MTLRYVADVRDARNDVVKTAVDAGSDPGVIELRTGSQPATADTAATGSILATFDLADPSFAASAAGVMDLDADPDLSATATGSGTAGWARCYDSDGNAVFDGAVATSGGEYTITSTTITSGQTVTLTLGSITDPA